MDNGERFPIIWESFYLPFSSILSLTMIDNLNVINSNFKFVKEWNYVCEFENLNLWLNFVVSKSLRMDEYVWNKLRQIKVNLKVKMKRFNSKLFYCLLYLIPTVLSSGDAGNKGSIFYLIQLGAWHLNCEASS